MTNRELRIKITMVEAKIAALKLQLESLEQERDVRERFDEPRIKGTENRWKDA